MRWLICAVLSAPQFFLVGCGSDVPTFDPLFPDPEPECVEEGMEGPRCPAGQICLGARCFEPCESDAQCSIAQMCMDGVCVTGGDRPDSGPRPDVPPAACDLVMCDVEPNTACHPTGTCVQCIDMTGCTPAARICDLAAGICRDFAADLLCAPCNEDFDCDGGRVCAELSGTNERVCVVPCPGGVGCPQGFSCGADEVCDAALGTCTGMRNAVTNATCMVDDDCTPIGVTAQPDTCRGEDVGMMIPGRCVHLCGTADQCPAGYICDGTTCVAM